MGNLWLLNTQVAFISSLLIVLASFFSYKNMVDKRLLDGDAGDDRDVLDSIDDKYELYDEKEEASVIEFKEIYKQERKKSSEVKKSLVNLFKSWSGALSVFRIISYGVLFVALLVLIKQGLFEPIAFLVGVSGIPIASLFVSFMMKDG
jgi:hypothetical protein